MVKSRKRRRPKNLLLDAESLAIGSEYCERHGTTLSRLVEDYLRALAIPRGGDARSPIVRRLRGIVSFGNWKSDTYRDYVYGLRVEGDIGDLL